MVCLQLQVDIAISGEQDPLTWAVTAGCSSFLLCSSDRNHSIKMRTASLSRKLKSHRRTLPSLISEDFERYKGVWQHKLNHAGANCCCKAYFWDTTRIKDYQRPWKRISSARFLIYPIWRNKNILVGALKSKTCALKKKEFTPMQHSSNLLQSLLRVFRARFRSHVQLSVMRVVWRRLEAFASQYDCVYTRLSANQLCRSL